MGAQGRGWGSGTGVQHKQRFRVICAEQTSAMQKSALAFRALLSFRCLWIHACLPLHVPPLIKCKNWPLEPGCISRTGLGNSACGLGWSSWKHLTCGPPREELDLCSGENIVHSNHDARFGASTLMHKMGFLQSKVTGKSVEEYTCWKLRIETADHDKYVASYKLAEKCWKSKQSIVLNKESRLWWSWKIGVKARKVERLNKCVLCERSCSVWPSQLWPARFYFLRPFPASFSVPVWHHKELTARTEGS